MTNQIEPDVGRTVEANESRRQKAQAERTEREKNEPKEEEAVREASHLSAKLVYQVVRREGDEELGRPGNSLFWSGIAAGVCISFSVIAEAVFATHLPDVVWLPLVESLGYTFGFLIVITGRMQLFTENTLTTVLPLFARPTWFNLTCVARLWGIVLGGNIIGCFLAAAFIAFMPTFGPEMLDKITEISIHATENDAWNAFGKAVPAGLLIAALVWMLAAGEMDNFLLIIVMTWLIAAGGFTHIIAGSVEMAFLMLTGELGIIRGVFSFFIPVLLGNIFGGTVVFALITWGQVREEVNDASDSGKRSTTSD
ncbi:formate/nitrite transporter family protein [Loktanella sp. DJP18]|uniref:formate/nitrite transporter family protein n=1 Tax=Loktanella sp. DJP18 TaxID=3409788 RepID=UPI003BB7AF9A